MKINVLTIFPEVFEKTLDFGMMKRAADKGKASYKVVNIRDYAEGRHKNTDDTPYGGSGGMVMTPAPVVKALRGSGAERGSKKQKAVLLSAAGKKLTQKKLAEYAKLEGLTLVCGRYEGVDERVLNYVDEEISIGDYVLSGGEFAALAVIEGVIRLLPGVLGNEESNKTESFTSGILDFPQYTRPEEFEGLKAPGTLLSGNHEIIRKWRRKQALKKTMENRPELLDDNVLTKEDKKMIEEIRKGEN